MAQNFHVTPLTSSKPKESSNRSTIIQLVERLTHATTGHVSPVKELDDGLFSKVTHVSNEAKIVSRPDLESKSHDIASQDITTVPNGAPKPSKVIVVGAGISGLRAASVLKSHGIEVVVLEGRPDRIGGRILTSRKPGKAARDIGAAWMHETAQNKLVGLIRHLDIEHYYDDGTPLYYTRDGRAGAQFKAKKVADEFADYCEWYYEENPDAEDRSVLEFITEWIQDHELITEDERKWAPQAVREVEAWIGTGIEKASSKHLSYFITERNLYMKGGYDSVVNWTAQNLREPGVICLGQNVKEIEWNDNHSNNESPVKVHTVTEDGSSHEFTADAVICTVSLGVLHHGLIKFSPGLPPDLSLGLQKLSYGALGKVFFEFESVFWSKDNDQFIYYPSPSKDTIDKNSIFSYMTVTSNNWIMSGTTELSVQIVEPLTQRIEAMKSENEIYAFFEPLFRLFRTEPYKDLPRLVSLETTHWTQDPFAGYGTYTADKTGDEPDLWTDAVAARKASKLQFAGEHCTRIGNGCVHGAFATGETAAVNVLKTLGVPHNGGDSFSLGAKRSPRGSRK